MATEEARKLLNALMGVDRNAPLPKGAAVPGAGVVEIKRQRQQKSCFDKDIDPLYTAWGVDVYELFVNTKSDIGPNPYVVDKGAHKEFLRLPKEEQDQLGYHYFLFQKLQELVRQCDRIVQRSKEKLRVELSRKQIRDGGEHFVEAIDPGAVEQLARGMVGVEELTAELNAKLEQLEVIVAKEEDRKSKLEVILKAVAAREQEQTGVVKMETDGPNEGTSESDGINESAMKGVKIEETSPVPQDDECAQSGVKEEEDQPSLSGDDRMQLQTELGQLTLQKQRLLFDISHLMPHLVAQQDTVDSQRRHLNYVKSDISTDKTVCEVSGNFMSSRDADERIAAHYAGKQYQGWKLVRDKYADMKAKYGPYGPPPPQARGPLPAGGPRGPPVGGRGGPPPPQRGDRGGYGPPDRGGGIPAGGRWERDRGGGGYDRSRPPPMGPPRGGWR